MARILIVDDSPIVRAEVRRTLARAGLGPDFVEAGDGLAGFRNMVSPPVDLVVTDLEMPKADATKMLALLASHPVGRHIPVLVLTGIDNPDSKAWLLDLGASDYVTKPFHPAELVARAKVHLRLKAQEEELRLAMAKLSDLARTDPLTSLGNRRAFDEAITREVDRARRYGSRLSLVSIDLDHFKSVNDTHGHATGDAVLAGVASFLRMGIRTTDLAARVGGEELALLLPETSLRDARDVANRLRATIAEHAFMSATGAPLRVTASFGVASADQLDRVTVEALVAAADEAVYAAKHSGRDRVCIAQSSAREELATMPPPT